MASIDCQETASFHENYTNCNLAPTDVTDSFWLWEYNERIQNQYPLSDGKWMFFYPKSQLDAMWNHAKFKYRAGILTGISSMKVSTARDNPRARNKHNGVILFYCGPSNDKDIVLKYGLKLLEEIPCSYSSEWIFYKTDEQTSTGTCATGQRRNHTYRLRCSRDYHRR